jgi:hypothetical protein
MAANNIPGGYWKFIVAVLGAVALVANTLLGAHAFDAETQKWLTIIVAVGTALGVYLKANTGADSP